jgi:enediyne biosynthesis protein E4
VSGPGAGATDDMSMKPYRLIGRLCACSAGCALLAGCDSKQVLDASAEANAGARPAKLALTPPIAAGPRDLYEDVTAQAGITFVHQFCHTRIANILLSNGAGVAILDYDNDGFMDIYFVNSGPLDGVTNHLPGTRREPNRLYRNRGDGTFEDVTDKAGVAGSGFGVAAAAADYDNDGFTDLLVVNVGSSILYRNRGDGTFEDVTAKAGITHSGTGIGAVFVDVDNDGHLDLFIANYLTFNPDYNLYFNPDAYPGPLSYKAEFNMLFRNRGNGTFEDISERSGIQIPGHRAMSVTAFDFDKDGDQDLYICNDATPNLLLVNDGKGNFTEQALAHWVAYNAVGEAAGSMTAAIGDCNGDLIQDILVARLGYGSLYIGSPNKVFSDQLMASGIGSITAQYVGWGCNFLDFDNDGDLDVFIANGDPHHLVGWESLLIENNGQGKFTDAAAIGGAFFHAKLRARASVLLDFNNDGRLDVLVASIADRSFLLLNRGTHDNNWITLDLQGNRSNRDGFGSRITLHAGSKTFYAEARSPAGFLSTADRRVHVGLGKNRVLDKIEIIWPSGTVQVLENVSADQILKVKEP